MREEVSGGCEIQKIGNGRDLAGDDRRVSDISGDTICVGGSRD